MKTPLGAVQKSGVACGVVAFSQVHSWDIPAAHENGQPCGLPICDYHSCLGHLARVAAT